ncbi:MAG: VWA domain-containing protein [archaeon]
MIDITFDNPMYLWYLISIPFLVYTHFYLMRHSKLKAMKFANFDALKRVSGEKLITKNLTVLVIRTFIIACIIMAVSGTTIWYNGKVSQNDFVIAIDSSASMAAQDLEPTRLESAKSTAIELVKSLKTKSQIGIVTFAGTTFIDIAPIDNRDTLIKTIEAIEISKTGGTDIAGAIITGTNMLLSSQKGKTIIIMTDGSNTIGAFITDSVKNALDYAKRNHVVIHSIGVGSERGPIGYLPEYYNVSAVYNENTLLDISNQTGGKYFKAEDKEAMASIITQISEASDTAMIPVRLNYGLMLVVLLLLFVEWGFISTRFRRIP